MITVGLTGNVAGGKTTIANHWREGGVRTLDADLFGHRVLTEDAGVARALVAEFGETIVREDDRIDRAKLGELAFADAAGLRQLNAIVHPPLLEHLDAALTEAAAEGCDLVVVDAALIFEFHLDEAMDVIVLVTAPKEDRAERLRRDRGLSDERIEQLMAAQLPDRDKAEECDYVIMNDGGIRALLAEADRVLAAIRERGARDDEVW